VLEQWLDGGFIKRRDVGIGEITSMVWWDFVEVLVQLLDQSHFRLFNNKMEQMIPERTLPIIGF